MALTTLHKRILSALVLGPLTLGIIFLGGKVFLGLIVAGAMISLYEFYNMERQGKHLFLIMPVWVAYIAICAYSFITLRMTGDGLFLVLAVMLTVWACDIGAYATGKAIGGPKMAPRLSPKKTWAGLAGGMICSGLTLAGFDMVRDICSAPIMVIFAVGLAAGLVGQAGDLLVSSVKRRVGVKDTGHIIPGHGGLLDRIDSLLLVVPFFLLMHFLYGYFGSVGG